MGGMHQIGQVGLLQRRIPCERGHSHTISVLSMKLGRSIKFDPETESIMGDKEAARLAVPRYRDSWKFPGEYL
jgi:hypothetical protein